MGTPHNRLLNHAPVQIIHATTFIRVKPPSIPRRAADANAADPRPGKAVLNISRKPMYATSQAEKMAGGSPRMIRCASQ